jgi:hypothetical protein
LERDRDALLEYYAGMVPEALEKLTGEERRQVYEMLRLRVRLSADESMEASGILRENLHILYEDDPATEGNGICENELASRCNNQITKLPELRFRTVQAQGICELKLALI